jgi:hypothetical protein
VNTAYFKESHRKMSVNGSRIEAGEKRPAAILLSFQDITPKDLV